MDVAIVGIGMHPFGRTPGKSGLQQGAVAVRAALADAGCDWRDMQFAFGGSHSAGSADALVNELGLTGLPFTNVANGCATGGSSLMAARSAILSGEFEIGVVAGFDKHDRGAFNADPESMGLGKWYGEAGLMVTTQFFGMKIQRYMHDYGITPLALARVAEKAFLNGELNPNAWRRSPVPIEQILSATMVNDPLTKYMFCSPSEGAVALVLCRADIAHRYTPTPVFIKGAVLRSRRYGSFEVFAPAQALEVTPGPTVDAARAVFEQAGIGPGDIDVAQLQDTESGAEIMHMAENGFCEHGEQEGMLARGETRIGGRLPVNTDGGCIANGEPIGASGLRQIHENVVQLRGAGGARQVPGAPRTAYTHVYGAPGISATTILARWGANRSTEVAMTQKHQLDPRDIIARSEGPSYQELLDREPVPAPGSLRDDTVPYLGSENLSFDRYLSRDFHEREVQKLRPKTWLVVCRESQLPNAGDYFSYEITRYNILVRSPSGALRGFHNSCRHRGRTLKRGSGNATELRCPYHSFAWDLDGAFKGAPCMWDFKHIDSADFGLPEVKVDTWGGWVFINMDLEATPLLEHMGIVPEHFARWEIDQRYVSLHVEKVIACNWKAASEAFIESYHAIQTHPQILVYSGIDNSQYDVWGDNVSRTITTMGVVNPSHTSVYSEQDCIDTILGSSALIGNTDEKQEIEQGRSARERIAEISYDDFSAQWGRDIRGEATHSEVMDSILYLVFPNFMPWGGYLPTLTYRHRPNGDDHESCIMDIYILTHFPKGSPRPADAPTVRLAIDEPFSKATEMGEALGRIFDQDGANLPQVQRGMKASKTGEAVLANYQEIRIRHFHQTIDKYLDA